MPQSIGRVSLQHARNLLDRSIRRDLCIGVFAIAASENRIFHALADPSRRAIFVSLTRGEAAVKDLTSRFDISQPAVSQHLATLKDAGLVKSRREGRLVYYRVEPKGLKPLVDWITHYRAFWVEHADRLEQLLRKMDS